MLVLPMKKVKELCLERVKQPKLMKNEDLVKVRRESTFLRYTANTQALQDILAFLFAECCTRNTAIKPEDITCCQERS